MLVAKQNQPVLVVAGLAVFMNEGVPDADISLKANEVHEYLASGIA